MVWRSPAGQPRWVRPALLLVAALAGLAYAWGANGARLEPFYGAAARSMSQSWHDFIFGAFDPAGTVTVDKLPGALWLQALSLRIFGFHVWAVVLPQILEGVGSVLVLYRAVRRLGGPIAGIAAAIALASTPVTVALNRGNVSDSLLILLTVLAADATGSAIESGRMRPLLLAGVWVGLAFQAKMLQAWLVLPALAVAYMLGAAAPVRQRTKRLGLAGLVVVVVSLSWMSVVSLVPAGQRPYVDGSRNDSLFSQVFVYNGYGRLGRSELRSAIGTPPAFVAELTREAGVSNARTYNIKPGWARLLSRPLGRDCGWLLPAALLATLLLAWDHRRSGRRRDPRLACLALWLTWLLVLGVSFSAGVYVNSYYLAALAPAVAAICGLGADLFWRNRSRPLARLALATALALSAGYGAFLLAGGSGVPSWVRPLGLGVTVVGVAALIVGSVTQRAGRALGAIALLCMLGFPAATSAVVVSRELGPFNLPYAPGTAHTVSAAAFAAHAQDAVTRLESVAHARIPLATYTSMIASEFILYTGKEVLPIGGFSGAIPSPTLQQLSNYVKTGQLGFLFAPIKPALDDPRISWIDEHCKMFAPTPVNDGVQFAGFDCRQHP